MNGILIKIIILSFLSTVVYGEDSVKVRILTEFDKENYSRAVHISSIEHQGIVRLWCWVKVRSESTNIKPIKYYIELGLDDGSGRRILSDHNKEPNIFVFERPDDQMVAYHWLAKRIWTSNEGVYDFTVYTLEDGKKRTVGTSRITVRLIDNV